ALPIYAARTLVLTSFVTFGRHTPRSNRMTSTRGSPFTTTVGVVNWVHSNTADGGAYTTPALSTCLAKNTQAMLGVTYFTQRRTALDANFPHLTGLQTHSCVGSFPSDQLCRTTGGTGNLPTLTRLEFDTVNRASQGNVAQRQRTTSTDGSIHTRQHFIACSQTFGCNNVTTLAIGILQQRDVGGAVRIILQALYNGFNAIFITLEIDQTVMLLVATTF